MIGQRVSIEQIERLLKCVLIKLSFSDSPQVAQVYVPGTRIPHPHYPETGARYYDSSRQMPAEPPPAHRPSSASGAMVVGIGGNNGGGGAGSMGSGGSISGQVVTGSGMNHSPANLSHHMYSPYASKPLDSRMDAQQQQQQQREQRDKERDLRTSNPGSNL